MFRKTAVVLAWAVLLTGCGGGRAAFEPGRTAVVAGFYPLAYAAERVGGDRVDVVNLTPPGAEPHDVELTIRDVERVRAADVVLYLRGFQPALERALGDAAAEGVDLLGAGTRDPHVWLDPLRFADVGERIGTAVRAPSGADAFAADLRSLHAEYERGLRDCARREVVTTHAAFGHLTARYGLEQIAITGLTPEAEPSPAELEAVVEQVRRHRATTVFAEPLVSPKVAETVAREAGAATAVLNPIEGLTDEELERGEDYFSVMRRNLDTLRRALGCR